MVHSPCLSRRDAKEFLYKPYYLEQCFCQVLICRPRISVLQERDILEMGSGWKETYKAGTEATASCTAKR